MSRESPFLLLFYRPNMEANGEEFTALCNCSLSILVYICVAFYITEALRKIVDNNNLHYKSDFEYDAEMFKEAAAGSHFLWLSRNSGTACFDERDVYIKNSYAHQTWRYYNEEYDGVKAFAVTVRGSENGRVFGDIYELDYEAHKKEMNELSTHAKAADVTFKATHTHPETTRQFEIVEYTNLGHAIVSRYGDVESVKYTVADENALQQKLNDMRNRRESEAEPANVNSYVREMVATRFHAYGYTQDEMRFTTIADVYDALKHNIPVYVLNRDNTKEIITDKASANKHLSDGLLFGMNDRDKQLLYFYTAGKSLDDLPLTRNELKAIFFMVLDKGKDNITDEAERKIIDNIIHVLDKTLFAASGDSELSIERAHDESEGYEQ